MKVTLEGEIKEIADLIAQVQGQPRVTSAEAAKAMTDSFNQAFVSTRDNDGEYCGR